MNAIGEFFWYSIPQGMMPLERVRRAWRTAGLPLDHLPQSRKPADVAAEACGLALQTAVQSFTQIENSKERLLYRVESNGIVHDLIFDKSSASFSCLHGDVLRTVVGYYEANGSKLPAHKQRQVLRDFLLSCGAENLHGSIYFMPTPYEVLDKVETMIVTLYPRAEFHWIAVNREETRQVDYLAHKMTEILRTEMNLLKAEVRQMIVEERPRKWRRDKIETLMARQDTLNERWARFHVLLGDGELLELSPISTAMGEAVKELLLSVDDPLIV